MDQDHTSLYKKDFQKMVFLYNTLNNGWTIRKYKDAYIFTKKHENRKEVFQTDYLDKFIETNRTICPPTPTPPNNPVGPPRHSRHIGL